MEPPFESLGGRGGQQGAVPGPEPEDGVQYEIEAVLDERKCGGQGTKRKEYLVTYKNWGDEWDAWLSKAQIKNCGGGAMEQLESFKKQRVGATMGPAFESPGSQGNQQGAVAACCMWHAPATVWGWGTHRGRCQKFGPPF